MSTILIALSIWLHTVATIVMVGYFVFTSLIYLPVFELRMQANALRELLEQVSARLRSGLDRAHHAELPGDTHLCWTAWARLQYRQHPIAH